jgi:cytochrome c5
MRRYVLLSVLVLAAFAFVAAAAASETKKEKSGEAVYKQYCFACHATGVAGAPKLGDKAAWEPRVKTGKDTLLKKAMSGLNAMPPKGTCMECSEQEIKNAIDFMLSKIK